VLKGFKDFILRGNVIDLAVGIVIGAAFTALVGQFTKSFLEPLIRLVDPRESDASNKKTGIFSIGHEGFDWAAFLNAAITFAITAAALYFLVVLPMNKLAERRRRGLEPEPERPSEEVALLMEIRDALRERPLR
jgi:large conductance mechanosensitive channel